MTNPYEIKEPSIVSFSGGRTSAFMLYKIISAHGGKLPEHIKVVFCNTGKEMPQTLDFVKECGDRWDINIEWLELCGINKDGYKPKEGGRDWIFEYRITDFDNCFKNGEPFEILIDHYGKLPNHTNRFCTFLLKQRAIIWYERIKDLDNPDHILGLRYDEPHRVHRIKARKDNKEHICPLYDAKHTSHDVQEFWNKSNFDLNLIYRNGHTVWGNCDMCFLKGKSQLNYMMKQTPELADWWIEQEERTGKTFKYDTSFKELRDIDKQQRNLFSDLDNQSIDCFCHD